MERECGRRYRLPPTRLDHVLRGDIAPHGALQLLSFKIGERSQGGLHLLLDRRKFLVAGNDLGVGPHGLGVQGLSGCRSGMLLSDLYP